MTEMVDFDRYEDRGAGMCAVFRLHHPRTEYFYDDDERFTFRRIWELPLNRESLEMRIRNSKELGLDCSVSEHVLANWPKA